MYKYLKQNFISNNYLKYYLIFIKKKKHLTVILKMVILICLWKFLLSYYYLEI